MKKICPFLFALILTGSFQLTALPIGNPTEPATTYCTHLEPCLPALHNDLFCVSVGYYGDFVFNRTLELTRGAREDWEDFESSTNAGYLSLYFRNVLEVFITLGATTMSAETNIQIFSDEEATGRIKLEPSTQWSYSLGAKGILFSYRGTSLGTEFQYFRCDPPLTKVTPTFFSDYPNPVSPVSYREWQAGLALSHQINFLVPYIGVKYSDVKLYLPYGADTNLVNSKKWGYGLGVSLLSQYGAFLCVEGRWGDESALYLNGQLRF